MERKAFLQLTGASVATFFGYSYIRNSELFLSTYDWEKSTVLTDPQRIDLNRFINEVTDGTPIIRGVYSPDNFKFPVIEQPKDMGGFVAPEEDVVTLYQHTEGSGNHVLLAHNYLAGEDFYTLSLNSITVAIRGNGNPLFYRVSDIRQFRTWSSTNGSYQDLETDKYYKAGELVRDIYLGRNRIFGSRLTLQTCLEKEGLKDWGLTFFIAEAFTPDSDMSVNQ